MGDLVPYRSPKASDRTTAYVGMIIFVAAWAMMFSCLFFAYAALRVSLKAWPPPGQPALPLTLPGLNTLIIVGSSLVLEAGLRGIRLGRPQGLAPGIGLAVLLGAIFLGIQCLIGFQLHADGLAVDGGAYGAVVYGLAGIHGLHVLVGLVALLWLLLQAVRGKYNTPQHLPVRLWAIYWHFVGIIWVMMFASIFVL